MLSIKTHSFASVFVLLFLAAVNPVSAQDASTAPAGPAPTTKAGIDDRELPPREAIERTITPIVDLLKDKSLQEEKKVADINGIVREKVDFAILSRLMIGQAWEDLTPEQRQAFIDEFSRHLMGVYVPMMTKYDGQQVQVVNDRRESRGDHTVFTKVSDVKGGKERQVALIACRMRQGERGWKVIDLTVEGISVGGLFAAQLRPVLAREGFDGLMKRLQEKNAQRTQAKQRG